MYPQQLWRSLRAHRHWWTVSAAGSRKLQRWLSSSPHLSKQPVLAIRREESSVWERRAPLNPNHVQSLAREGVKVLIQPSNRRAYSIREYEAAGAIVTDDFSEADTILSVKQVPTEKLEADKTYVFFSHTIKAQKDNMSLLDAVLEKGIRLIDYECLVDERGLRLVAFGKYAGVTGMINILHGLGLRLLALGHHTPFMHVGTAHNYAGSSEAKAAVASLGREIQYGQLPESLGPLLFTFCGAGNVSQGAQDVFCELPHEFVKPTELKDVMETGDMRKVYATVVDRWDHLVRKDGRPGSDANFTAHPDEYTSTFFDQVIPYTTCLVNGGYWAPGHPRLITTEQCRQLHPREFDANLLRSEGVPALPQRLLAIADISCDLYGALEFTTQCTTIDNPFIIYDSHTEETSLQMSANGVVMMTVDNLPAQLPREATDYFGSRLLPFITEFLKVDGSKPLQEYSNISRSVKDAVIAYNGSLTERYQYIAELRRKNEEEAVKS